MGRPPSCGCVCECFDPVELDSWIGPRTINPDMTSYPGWTDQLANDPRALIWAVVLKSTGEMPDGTTFRMRQPMLPAGSWLGQIAPVQFEFVRKHSDRDGAGVKWLPLQVGTINDGYIQRAWGDHSQYLNGASEPLNTLFSRSMQFVTGLTIFDPDQEYAFVGVNVDEDNCPGSIELTCDNNGLTFSAQFEYALVVICVPECDDPLDDWWSNYEQSTYAHANQPTFDLRMNDALHLDQTYCRNGASVSSQSRCQPHVGMLSLISGWSSPPEVDFFGGGSPYVAVSNLKSVYGIPRCHFTARMKSTYDDIAQEYALHLATDWSVWDRVEVMWISGFFSNVDTQSLPPLPPPYATTNGWSSPISFLSKLTDWLDQGERVLVIDGHYLPADFYAQLGLTTTIGVEQIPNNIAPITHPFTTGCTGSLIACSNHHAVRSLGIGAGGVMIGEGTDYLTLATFPAIACETWAGNPTSRVVIFASYTNTATSFNTFPFPQANRLSSAGNATFLRNFDTQRLVF